LKRRNFITLLPLLAIGTRSETATASDFLSTSPELKGSPMNDITVAAAGSRKVLVFDVIETLLDLNFLAPRFEKTFGTSRALDEFFAQMLQSAFAITSAGIYTDFGKVAKAALQMVAERRGVVLTNDGMMQILSGLRSLPAHPDVPASLALLKKAGYRMAALTNSALPVLEAQVTHAGLKEYFDVLLTVDTVKRFKPAPEVYQEAAKTLGVTTADIRMVAAHSWDVGGAMQAGCSAAFVARPGMVLDPLFAKPDIVGKDLKQVADLIIQTDKPRSVS
jgi:2-haloacid dehalogenase